MDVVLLALPAVARARLDCVVAGLVEQGVGPSHHALEVGVRDRPLRGSRGRGGQEERLAGPERADAGQVALVEQGGADRVGRGPQVGQGHREVPVRTEEVGARGVRRGCSPRWSARARAGRGAARARVHVAVPTRGTQVVRRSQRAVSAGVSTRHWPSILQVRVQGDPGVEPVQQVLAPADHLGVIEPRRSSVARLGKRRSLRTTSAPARARWSRWAVRQTMSPSGTTVRGPQVSATGHRGHRRSRSPRGVAWKPALASATRAGGRTRARRHRPPSPR